MEGRQKLFYLPEPHTDFIFANVCEELGIIGALFVIGLFVALGYRGLRTAILSTDPFARFLAFGITSAVLIQAFFKHQRGAGAAAHEGHHAALHLLRRHIALRYAGEYGRAAEHHA